MATDIQHTLLQLFQQVSYNPDDIPVVPVEQWREGSVERQLLTGFRQMLERLQQSRQQAEEQLREKEAQYRSIFEATTDALFINDMDGLCVEVNPAACTMHGYSYEEFIGQYPTFIGHSDYHHRVAEFFQTIKAGDQFQARTLTLRKDGSAFPVEIHGTAFTYKGKPHTLAVARDISERAEAEEQLREKEVQYRSIFEATSDGLIINDLEDGHIVEVNAAACRMYGYPYDEFLGLRTRTILHPDYQHVFAEFIRTVRRGEQFRARAVVVHKGGSLVHIEVYGTGFMYLGKSHALSAVRDITEQVQAEEQLREKEAQYRNIFEATSDGLMIIDLEDGCVVEVNPAACRMFGYSYEEFLDRPYNVLIPPDELPLAAEGIQAIQAGRQFHARGVALRKDGSRLHIEARITPFIYKGRPHLLSVDHDITEQVQAQHLLEQRVEQRTRELATLLEVSHNVGSTIELKPLLGLVLDQLKSVADYTGSTILTVEGDEFVLVDNRGPAPLEQVLHLRFSPKEMGLIWQMIESQELVSIDDVRSDTPLAQAFREWLGERLETTFRYIRAWMGIPLTHKERVIGMLTLSSDEPDYFTPRHATLALAIANQAAVAIENARLYEQAQELAAMEERQRLARELHDSVSQALYGITLGTHTARTLLSRDPGKVAEPLNYVLAQAETALTEMRALIFELRPESLEAEGLVATLNKQAAALHARHGIAVSTELSSEPDVPLRVKQELCRVAQEALHNTVKHARAREVKLHMAWTTEGLLLEVRDDGVGFDAASSFPGHLGLHSMRERITHLGGLLQIESAPGAGTRIRAWLPHYARR